jgi:hypothetical protein
MAFPSAAGYGNLPNGVFSPVIYSAKVQKEFRKSSVVEDITNTDYFGEIANYGDSVKIIKEPEITVSNYKRGTTVSPQDMNDADFSLVIDQANYFAFKVDDIEAAHSHVNWMDLATDRAAYRLRDTFDAEVLGYLAGYEKNSSGVWIPRTAPNGTKQDSTAGADELLAAHKLNITSFGGADLGVAAGPTSVPLAANGGSGAVTSPLELLNRMSRIMDQKNIETEGRWFVADPVFYELLMDENSKLINNDFAAGQDAGGILRNGRVVSGLIRGFKVYKSNNLPFIGTGAGTTAALGSETNYGVVVAGHMSAVATAQQLAKTESYRDPDSFADIVRGMQLYGRKVLRSEGLLTAIYNVA